MTTTIDQYADQKNEHLAIEAQAQSLAQSIKDPATYQTAAGFLVRLKDMRKRWAEIIKPAVKAAHEAHQRIKDVEKVVDEPLARAEINHLKPALARYEMIEEAKRREEQERINRELRKQEEDRRLALAAQMEQSGKQDEAMAVIEEPIIAPEVVLPKTTEAKGITYRTTYSAAVVDLRKLVKAVAEGKAPLEFLMPNGTVLNAQARSLKESLIPQWEPWGLTVKAERTVSAGGYR